MSGQELKVAEAAKAVATGGDERRERPAWLERLVGSWQDFRKFLHDVRGEMGHVTWPSTPDVRSQTLIVIVTIFFFGLFFFVVDGAFGRMVQYILSRFGHS